MKKFVLALLTAALVVSQTAYAGGWHGARHGGYGGHWQAGGDFWPVVGAVIAGGIVLSALAPTFSHVHTQPSYSPPPPPPTCFTEEYGEWRLDRYGNRFWLEFAPPRRLAVPCW